MKILYAHLYDHRFRMGGAEKVVLDLAQSMGLRFGHEVACAVNEGDLEEEFKSSRIRTSRIYFPKWRTIETIMGLKKMIRDFRPSVIHSHHRYTTFLVDTLLKGAAPLIHTEHVLRNDKGLFFRPGNYATAVSEKVRENLIHYYGVPRERVFLIPNAVSLRPVNREKIEVLKQKYFSGDPHCIALCVGRFEEQKGHAHLIKALGLMPLPYRKKIRIFLAGDGTLEGRMKEEVNAKGLENCVTFLGYSDDIPEWLSLCDFFVLPSLYEGMPLTVLEAFASKKPVIGTQIPGIKELISDTKTGLLVPPGNPEALAQAIQRLADQPGQTQSMGSQAFEWYARHVSFDSVMAKYHELYEKAAEGAAK